MNRYICRDLLPYGLPFILPKQEQYSVRLKPQNSGQAYVKILQDLVNANGYGVGARLHFGKKYVLFNIYQNTRRIIGEIEQNHTIQEIYASPDLLTQYDREMYELSDKSEFLGWIYYLYGWSHCDQEITERFKNGDYTEEKFCQFLIEADHIYLTVPSGGPYNLASIRVLPDNYQSYLQVEYYVSEHLINWLPLLSTIHDRIGIRCTGHEARSDSRDIISIDGQKLSCSLSVDSLICAEGSTFKNDDLFYQQRKQLIDIYYQERLSPPKINVESPGFHIMDSDGNEVPGEFDQMGVYSLYE